MSAENFATPLLTVAMPIYNGGDQLRLAMLSVIGQSFTDWELILIDDGSSDHAVETLKDIFDQRVRIISDGHNKGLAARLNQAIDLARGEYFARMDQDDICHPYRFERQLAVLKSNLSLDLCAARCVTISEANQLTGTLPSPETHSEICRRPWLGFYMPHPTWMGRTSWFRRHRYATPGPYCCEDQELLLRAHTASRFYALPEFLLAYRVRDRIGFAKAWRTRNTIRRIQHEYFTGRREYLRAALAEAVFCLRVAKDIFWLIRQSRFFKGNGSSLRTSVINKEFQEWSQIIEELGRVCPDGQSTRAM